MLKLVNTIPGHDRIRNIIFDFGNVICDIDIRLTEEKFREFGPSKASGVVPEAESKKNFDLLVESYETGQISSGQFRAAIRNHYATPLSDAMIDAAWNALLLPIPEHRIRLLEALKPDYRLFLLSNSNEIHYLHYLEDFKRKTGLQHFDELFDKAYFSFQVKLAKPAPEIFKFVLEQHPLDPSETLFIDDTLKHVVAAREAGIFAYHLQNGSDICSLFI
jgi:putative hydrolase of the HAD superfamily